MTALELIQQERKEQIEKHGFTIEFHRKNPTNYMNGELVKAAKFCMNPNENVWPINWIKSYALRIKAKDRIGQLSCAGAFILAKNEVFRKHPNTDKILKACIDELQGILDNPENNY